jgi:hypothetical protein
MGGGNEAQPGILAEKENPMEHLTEVSVPNLLILAGLVFLVVGIFGKVGGFIGNILGQIQAGEKTRVLAGVLGAVLVIVGIVMHVKEPTLSPAPAPTPALVPTAEPSAPAGFAGVWTDHDKVNQPKAIYKLEIQQNGAELSIHGWGGCGSPQNCDWGLQQTTSSGDTVEVTFPNDPLNRRLELTLGKSGELLGTATRNRRQVGSFTFLKSQ